MSRTNNHGRFLFFSFLVLQPPIIESLLRYIVNITIIIIMSSLICPYVPRFVREKSKKKKQFRSFENFWLDYSIISTTTLTLLKLLEGRKKTWKVVNQFFSSWFRICWKNDSEKDENFSASFSRRDDFFHLILT